LIGTVLVIGFSGYYAYVRTQEMRTFFDLAEEGDILLVDSHGGFQAHHSFQEAEEFIEEDL
jgi:hypothetical protein